MLRSRAVAGTVVGVVLILGAAVGDHPAGATTPPPTIPVSVPASIPAGVPASVPASVVPATVGPPVSTVPRAGSGTVSAAKPEEEPWSVRRIATTVGVAILVLAAAGFIYGRIRSTPPRHPDLVRSSE